MTTEIIPWQVFLEVLRNQPKAKSDELLANWCFNEQGAFLRAPVKPQNDVRQRLETAVVEFITLQSSNSQPLH